MTLSIQRIRGWLIATAGAALLATGCQINHAPGLIECPIPPAEQAAQLVEVVPLGTARENVLPKLKDAGIQGDFGENESIFYCDVWTRPNGERWHINVALLFDERGRLYQTRPGITDGVWPASAPGIQRIATPSESERDPFE